MENCNFQKIQITEALSSTAAGRISFQCHKNLQLLAPTLRAYRGGLESNAPNLLQNWLKAQRAFEYNISLMMTCECV